MRDERDFTNSLKPNRKEGRIFEKIARIFFHESLESLRSTTNQGKHSPNRGSNKLFQTESKLSRKEESWEKSLDSNRSSSANLESFRQTKEDTPDQIDKVRVRRQGIREEGSGEFPSKRFLEGWLLNSRSKRNFVTNGFYDISNVVVEQRETGLGRPGCRPVTPAESRPAHTETALTFTR